MTDAANEIGFSTNETHPDRKGDSTQAIDPRGETTTTPSDLSPFASALADLDVRGLRRRLRLIESAQNAYVLHNGRQLCCLCSNNYLGLANHPKVIQAVTDAVQKWGWGAGASQLVSGHMTPHQQLEESLARFKKKEAALICSTGYQANLAAIRALCTSAPVDRDDSPPMPLSVSDSRSAGPQPARRGGCPAASAGDGRHCITDSQNAGPAAARDVIFVDRLNHASIIDAARGSGAILRVFPHRDYAKLEKLLDRESAARRRIIVTDSLFSMDGDFADLPRLVELKNRYDALLVIDEAHATAVFGDNGQGLAEMMGVENQIDVVVGTLSKALGGIGGFIAASRNIIDWIINTGGPFIYTTALPPAACAAASAALDIIQSDEGRQRRERLLENAAYLRTELADRRNRNICNSTSQIIPLIIGDTKAAVELSSKLEEAGFLIPAIRPPSVPRNQARLRISLSSDHTRADIDRLLTTLDHFTQP